MDFLISLKFIFYKENIIVGPNNEKIVRDIMIRKKLNQNGGGINFVILHNPNPMHNKEDNTKEYNKIINDLDKLGNIHNYYFKFGLLETNFMLEDLKRIYVICFEEASPYGLYFSNQYSELCK